MCQSTLYRKGRHYQELHNETYYRKIKIKFPRSDSHGENANTERLLHICVHTHTLTHEMKEILTK